MSVIVIPVGRLKGYVGGQEEVRLDPEGKSVSQILEDLQIPTALVSAVLVEGTLVTKDYVPQDGEMVKLLSVMGGG